MSDENGDDPLAGILGDELGEWDKMFDSLHESAETTAPEAPVTAASQEEVAARELRELDPFAVTSTSAPAPGSELDFGLSDLPDIGLPVDADEHKSMSPFGPDGDVALGPPGAVTEDPVAIGDHELNFGGVPEALGTLLGSEAHEDLPLELSESAPATRIAAAPGIGDVAFDDALANPPEISAQDELARISESANAFFDEGESREISLELDEDFYDGIAAGGSAIPTPIPEDEPIESSAYAVPSEVFDNDGVAEYEHSAVTAVRDVAGLAADDLDLDGVVEESIVGEESNGIPEAIDFVDLSAPRAAGPRAESDDGAKLANEVEGALQSIRTGPVTPPPEAAAPVLEVLEELAIPDFDDGVIHDRVPQLDGVVEAAVEDAIAMSTGTLHTGPQLLEADVEPDLPPAKFSGSLPELDLGRIHVSERGEPDVSDRTEEVARLLVLYERELALLDEPGAIIRIRIEAGRLAESLGDLDTARRHLDEALKLDPRLVPANRALRRIERRLGNWDQVLAQLDNEIQKAGPMEARALLAYRADLLMAMGEPDLARVAVGELLDSAPKDTRALLANLELAFVDGREDEVQAALHALAQSLSGPRLRSSVCALAGNVAVKRGSLDEAAEFFAQAKATHHNLGAQLAQIAILRSSGTSEGGYATAEESGTNSSEVSAGLAWLHAEAHLARKAQDEARGVLQTALETAPTHALLLEGVLRTKPTPELATQAWCRLADVAGSPAETSAALCQAMHFSMIEEGDPAPALALLEQARRINEEDPCAKVWTRRLGADASDETDVGADPVAAFRRSQALREAGDLAAASAALAGAADKVPSLLPLAIEIDHAFGQADELARRYASMADGARSEEVGSGARRASARALTKIALLNLADASLQREAADAWRGVADSAPGLAAESALLLAIRTGESSFVSECELLASEQSNSVARRSQLTIASAVRGISEDPGECADVLTGLLREEENPRATELCWVASIASERFAEAAETLERSIGSDDASPHADRSRYRSAFVRMQHELDIDTAASSLAAVEAHRPEFSAAADLLRTARGHGGVAHVASADADGERMQSRAVTAVAQDSISAEIRQIEALARAGSHGEAADRSARLRSHHPDDALVRHAFRRHAWLASASADLAEYALAELRAAEERGDGAAKAEACVELARIDLELRGDRDSARMFWESGSKADPGRADLQRVLEGEYRGSESEREAYVEVLGRVVSTLEAGPERSAYRLVRGRLLAALERGADSIRTEYQSALADEPLCREALFYLESEASLAGPTETLATLEASVSQYFADDPRARGAFLVRAGETLRSLGRHDECLEHLKAALQVVPGFAPALSAWRNLALEHELWGELAEACLLEAESVDTDAARGALCLLAGVVLMDRVEDAEGAISALRKVLAVDPLHREAFVRLRLLFDKQERHEDLAQLYSMRLEAGPEDEDEQSELHLALARLLSTSIDNQAEALVHYRALLALRPNDKEAVMAVSQIAWDSQKWADAAEALMVLARIEGDQAKLVDVFGRLGVIYADHLPEPRWALKSFHKVVTLDPGNRDALHRIAELGAACGDYRLALGACEQLIKQEPPVAERIDVLIRMAKILRVHLGDAKNSERALRHALDLDASSDAALDALVQFYVEQKDLRSARVHVDRVANAMRKRIEESATDREAYRVLARAMAAKANAGAGECMPTAQVAASLAIWLGVDDAETAALAKQVGKGAGAGLAGDAFDDLLFPHSASGEARTLFSLLGGRLAKHIGIDIRSHGVGRSDRLRKGIDDAAEVILELSAEMGVEDVDIYVSKQKPNLVAVEPTTPVSLILGEQTASVSRPGELRFFVGRSLKGAAASLSSPLQLGVDRFGVLLVGLLRQFRPDFAPVGVDSDAASAEQQRLRRLIPSSLLQELQPYALGLATGDFDHKKIWQAMTDACNRAGLVCSGDGSAAIAGLMRCKGHSDLRKALQDPEIASLVRFACSSEHSRLWAAIRA